MAKIIKKEEWITKKVRLLTGEYGDTTFLGTELYCSDCNKRIYSTKSCSHCGSEFNGISKKEYLEEKEKLRNNPEEKSIDIKICLSQLHEDEEIAEEYVRNYILKQLISDLQDEGLATDEDGFDIICEYIDHDKGENLNEYNIYVSTTLFYMDNGEREKSNIKNLIKDILSNNEISENEIKELN